MLLALLITGIGAVIPEGFTNPGKQICGIVIPFGLLAAIAITVIVKDGFGVLKEFICQKGTMVWLILAIILGLTTFFN